MFYILVMKLFGTRYAVCGVRISDSGIEQSITGVNLNQEICAFLKY
jgi:hypothetical protein